MAQTSLIPRITLWFEQHRTDLLIALCLGTVFSVALFLASGLIDPVIYEQKTMNIWFEGDMPRILDNVTDRWGSHYRVRVHPLFSLIAYPPVYLLSTGAGLDPITVLRGLMALVGFGWLVVFFALLRRLGCARFDAVLFSLLGATSAASFFWFTAPDTYAFGSLSLLLAFLLFLPASDGTGCFVRYVVGNALTLSITVTNWMLGLVASIIYLPWKRAVAVTVCALALVAGLWCLQKQIFPYTEFFGNCFTEAQYTNSSEAMDPQAVACSFIYHSMVMPEIQVMNKFGPPDWPIMSVQSSLPGSSSALGVFAVVLWSCLLLVGLWSLLALKKLSRFRWTLFLFLMGQLGMHLFYGDETFLYSLHFAPFLIILSALGTLTRARRLSLVLAGLLLLAAGINNTLQYKEAIGYFQHHVPVLEKPVSEN